MASYFDGKRGGFGYSSKYRTLMNCFTKMPKMEHVIEDNLVESIPHILVIAAIIGHSKGLKEELEKDTNDVFIGGFNGLLHGQRLDYWVAMIVWLDDGGQEKTELFKEENDAELCKKFNQLAMGGLSYLYKRQFSSGRVDHSGLSVIKEEVLDAYKFLKN